jgi:hypothetical protein
MGLKSGDLSVKGGINLYQALVRSILEFSAEVWGFDAFPEAEKLQYEMCRRILRSGYMTTKEALLGELGFWLLSARRDLKKFLFWFRLLTAPDSRILKQAYLMSRVSKKQKAWAPRFVKMINKYNLIQLWKNPELVLTWTVREITRQKMSVTTKTFFEITLRKLFLNTRKASGKKKCGRSRSCVIICTLSLILDSRTTYLHRTLVVEY